jgi:DNA-binding MarR family transcriptional regulator
MTTVTEASAPLDEAIVDVEVQMSVLFSKARLVWKEAAQQVHPDLQPAAYKLLSTIVRLGSANAHVLAEMFEMDKSVVSRQIRILEELDLVETRADEHDGRVRVLVATPTALDRVREVRERNHARLRNVLVDHPESELRSFADLLRRIAEA